MKFLKTLILTALIPILGFCQSESLLFTTGTWGDSELSIDQLTRLNKIRSNFPTDQIYKVDFWNLRNKQIDGRIEIEVPNDDCEKVIFIAQDVRYISDDNYYWYGTPEPIDPNSDEDCKCEDGFIIIIKKADELFGTIQLDTRTYLIESLSGNKSVIVREPDEWTDNTVCGVDRISEAINPDKLPEIQPRSGGNCDVSVLFVYTESVGDNLSSPQNTAESILATTNQALRNSKIYSDDLELQLAGVEEITDVDEDGMDSGQALNAVTFSSPQTQNFRDNIYDADIVLLLINPSIAEFGNINGRAWLGPSANFAHGVFRAFGVGTTPAHEIAHIFGCTHEPCTAVNPGANCDNPAIPDRQAHSFTFEKRKCLFWKETHERQTIVFSESRDTRILNYSNPDVKVEDQPTGIVGERDNAKWLKDHACQVANFRNGNNPFTASIYTSPSNEGCDYTDATLYANIDGGCPGQYTWKWYKSYDGVNYTYISGYDNDDLDTYFEGAPGDDTYYKLEATSACGEQAITFEILHTTCWDGYGLISNNGGQGTLSAFPNPIVNGNLSFDFEVNEKTNVNYYLLDIGGTTIKNEDLGVLEKGKYTYRTTIPSNSSRVVLLKLVKGNEIESTKILNYE